MTTLRRNDDVFGTGSAFAVADTIIGVSDEADISVPSNALLDDDGNALFADGGTEFLVTG